MIFIDALKQDWSLRLPYHLRNNRYCGFARTCFQILTVLYYSVKAVILLELAFLYAVFTGLCNMVKWLYNKGHSSSNEGV